MKHHITYTTWEIVEHMKYHYQYFSIYPYSFNFLFLFMYFFPFCLKSRSTDSMRERAYTCTTEQEAEQEIYYPLILSPNVHNSWAGQVKARKLKFNPGLP